MKSRDIISKTHGTVYITTSCNHIKIELKDASGNLLISKSAIGFVGSGSSSLVTANKISSMVAHLAKERGICSVSLIVKGAGFSRKAAISAIRNAGLEIICIKDVTPLPHNGCRPLRKKRR